MNRRILFTGDSITRGRLGVGYLPILLERFPGTESVNLGLDGDTLSGIRTRTLAHLADSDGYDLVVIAGGHNDVILDAFRRGPLIQRLIVRSLERRGSVPAPDYQGFLAGYRSFLDSLRLAGASRVVLTTLSCINEDQSSRTARRRLQYNEGIRGLADEMDVQVADLGADFDRVLSGKECRDYFLPKPLATAFFDPVRTRTATAADRLSAARRLHLTIDGVHLNSAGALIYADSIAPFVDGAEGSW